MIPTITYTDEHRRLTKARLKEKRIYYFRGSLWLPSGWYYDGASANSELLFETDEGYGKEQAAMRKAIAALKEK